MATLWGILGVGNKKEKRYMQKDQLKRNYSIPGKECGNLAKESSSENGVNVPGLRDI